MFAFLWHDEIKILHMRIQTNKQTHTSIVILGRKQSLNHTKCRRCFQDKWDMFECNQSKQLTYIHNAFNPFFSSLASTLFVFQSFYSSHNFPSMLFLSISHRFYFFRFKKKSRILNATNAQKKHIFESRVWLDVWYWNILNCVNKMSANTCTKCPI